MNVIVTGASRGIGAAIARAFAAQGAHVLVNYLQNEEAARAVAADCERLGGRATILQGNVRDEGELKNLATFFPAVDVLVHNAAIGVLKPWDKIRTPQWDLTLESSLRPFWLLTKLCTFAEGANVVGISSSGSHRYVPGYAAMGVAKAGVEALTRQLAVELAPKVRVNTVCAGLIRTDAVKYLPEGDAMLDFADKYTPLGRVGLPEDVANAVLLLCDPRAAWITGQVVNVDGGASAR